MTTSTSAATGNASVKSATSVTPCLRRAAPPRRSSTPSISATYAPSIVPTAIPAAGCNEEKGHETEISTVDHRRRAGADRLRRRRRRDVQGEMRHVPWSGRQGRHTDGQEDESSRPRLARSPEADRQGASRLDRERQRENAGLQRQTVRRRDQGARHPHADVQQIEEQE